MDTTGHNETLSDATLHDEAHTGLRLDVKTVLPAALFFVMIMVTVVLVRRCLGPPRCCRARKEWPGAVGSAAENPGDAWRVEHAAPPPIYSVALSMPTPAEAAAAAAAAAIAAAEAEQHREQSRGDRQHTANDGKSSRDILLQPGCDTGTAAARAFPPDRLPSYEEVMEAQATPERESNGVQMTSATHVEGDK